MPSRLSSLLVSDGIVSVKRMEHAFQRQVIYGGCLDTILLEMNLLPEERLVQYLSKATGLPPATRAEAMAADSEVTDTCTFDVAKMYRVVPLCFADGALRILVHDPVDMATIEDLANDLGMPVQPLVVPEYRFHMAFAHVYEGTPDARYSTLSKRAEEQAAITPVGKARSVIVSDDGDDANADADAGDNSDNGDAGNTRAASDADAPKTEEIPTQEIETRVAPPAPERASSEPTVNDSASADANADEALDEASDDERRVIDIDELVARPKSRRRDKQTIQMATGALQQRSQHERSRAGSAPTIPAPIAAAGDTSDTDNANVDPDEFPTPPRRPRRAKTSPGTGLAHQDTTPLPQLADPELSALSSAEANALLAQADDRDRIFDIFLRGLRDRVEYAALLTVQSGAAIGRVAIDGGRRDSDDIAKLVIPLDAPSPFQQVVQSSAPQLGRLTGGSPDVDRRLVYLSGKPQMSALLLPVTLRNRVIAIAVGHNRGAELAPQIVAAALPLAAATAEAISRLIIASKRARQATRDTQLDMAPAHADSTPNAGRPGSDAGIPSAALDEQVSEGTVSAPIHEVLAALGSDDSVQAAAARIEAIARPAEVLAAIDDSFPGPLRVERYELEGRVVPAAAHGPVLDVVVALGAAACPLLLAKMASSDRDIRFYATLCAAESRPLEALRSLGERLFDSDYGIRSIAIDGLAGYTETARSAALTDVRDALQSDQPGRFQAAANALAKLGDSGAVPLLIDVLAQNDKSAEPARRALLKLTRQDFGTSVRKWRSWWNKHRQQHRIEWLIDGLGHKDENLRSGAVRELRERTGETFGFYHDLPRREREQARQRWLDWWERDGRARFGR